MQNTNFGTDITDAQWELLAPMLPKPAATARPPTPRRLLINAILYLINAGCPWHLLPKLFPPYKTVFHIFRRWTNASILASIHDRLRARAREEAERRSRPTQAIMDSQTVRSGGMAAEIGYDAAKKTKGRKRFVMVDTSGYILTILVTTADTTEWNGGKDLLAAALGYLPWLRSVWVDGGFSGPDFAKYAVELRAKLEIEVVKRSDTTQGFEVLPKRWVVQRTFGWLVQTRRLVRDYARTVSSAAAWIHVAMIRFMLRRLA